MPDQSLPWADQQMSDKLARPEAVFIGSAPVASGYEIGVKLRQGCASNHAGIQYRDRGGQGDFDVITLV